MESITVFLYSISSHGVILFLTLRFAGRRDYKGIPLHVLQSLLTSRSFLAQMLQPDVSRTQRSPNISYNSSR